MPLGEDAVQRLEERLRRVLVHVAVPVLVLPDVLVPLGVGQGVGQLARDGVERCDRLEERGHLERPLVA